MSPSSSPSPSLTAPSGSPRAASSALAVRVRDLRVVLGASLILDDVSLAVGAGESVALLGANGSGKSTLVKAILGLVPPAGGSIEVLGTPITRRRKVPWGRIGYVPQRIGAGSGVPATALEVVRSGLLGPRNPWADRGRGARRRAMAALDAVGLAHRAGDHVQVFSGGQAQRVLIARALVRSPELLILDEPLAGIDRASRESLATILQGLRAQGLTLVTVLHEMGELAEVVQRAILLQDGRLVADGPAGEVAHLRDAGIGPSGRHRYHGDRGDHHPDAGGPPAHHAPVLDHRLPEARPRTGRRARP
ncbi:metal ABC transporter ATP-binding protein [Actinomyces viscosus]|nr:metal ABC transporter ATP-binding protein [Actinomyces viscosus]